MNLYPPFADDHYHRVRPTLAIGEKEVIKLTDHYGLHPAMAALEPTFKEGRLGLIQAVGTDNTTGSHFECQDQMEHGDSMEGRPSGGGWLGRFLRERAGDSASALSAVAIGTQLPESLRGAPAVSVLEKLEDIAIETISGDATAVAGILRSLYGADVTLLGERGVQTLELFQRVSALQSQADEPANGAEYPEGRFGLGLREIARLIRAEVGLEVACIDLNGWDTHFFQGAGDGVHAGKAEALATGLAAFEKDLQDRSGDYTILVTTEFGRRIYENASLGTDHGRGFMLTVIGDAVKGGQVIGPWPTGAMDESNPLGPGGMEIHFDYRRVFAEVLRGTMGVSAEGLGRVFPGADLKPVGLMG
jgi:uncharacterized protein (DUF1501 family)